MAYTVKDASGNTLYMDGAGTGADADNAVKPNSTLIGAVNETAPANDTASAGLNGRLQRIAQRLTSLIALLPTSIGQKTKAGSLAVTLASDEDAINIGDIAGTVTLPTGAATSAKQDTIIGHVDGIEALLTTIDGDTGTVAGAVAGTEMQVDVVAALPAGTNTIGNVNIAEKTLAFATGTAASSGDNTIIAAPGSGQQIKIVALQLQNESAVATTMILKFGSTAKWRTLAQLQGDGMSFPVPAGRAWPVGNDAALVLNLSGANSCGYSVCYYTEAV